jgi:hypothetical protein
MGWYCLRDGREGTCLHKNNSLMLGVYLKPSQFSPRPQPQYMILSVLDSLPLFSRPLPPSSPILWSYSLHDTINLPLPSILYPLPSTLTYPYAVYMNILKLTSSLWFSPHSPQHNLPPTHITQYTSIHCQLNIKPPPSLPLLSPTCQYQACRTPYSVTCHNLMVASPDPLEKVVPRGCHRTQCTGPWWPRKVWISFPDV